MLDGSKFSVVVDEQPGLHVITVAYEDQAVVSFRARLQPTDTGLPTSMVELHMPNPMTLGQAQVVDQALTIMMAAVTQARDFLEQEESGE